MASPRLSNEHAFAKRLTCPGTARSPGHMQKQHCVFPEFQSGQVADVPTRDQRWELSAASGGVKRSGNLRAGLLGLDLGGHEPVGWGFGTGTQRERPWQPEVEGNYVPGLGLTRGPRGPTSAHQQNSGGIQHLHSRALPTSSNPEL